MKNKMFLFLGVIILLFAALAFVVNYQNKKASEGNPYGKDKLDQATIEQLDDPNYQNQILPDELEAKLENKEDVTVYFYSPTCEHCLRTTPVLVPMMEDYGVDMKKLNVLEFQDAWNTYNIEGTPTLIHFENGEEVARTDGEQPVEAWDSFIKENILNKE
ncbi:thioredoxin family protein [Radiobacillus kanasensis]|uniref:thioredoxin family protein n=1 Tax=Radiobacillus kanasensis TaxID=2844358 RepID=UPI001E56BA76|nr:thioredoxin family protein [Radiobacillus kanasensis]UFU00503.1 thioredoxin family protein [Radiobacillus kanasensis]